MTPNPPVYIEAAAGDVADAWLDRRGELAPLALRFDPRDVLASDARDLAAIGRAVAPGRRVLFRALEKAVHESLAADPPALEGDREFPDPPPLRLDPPDARSPDAPMDRLDEAQARAIAAIARHVNPIAAAVAAVAAATRAFPDPTTQQTIARVLQADAAVARSRPAARQKAPVNDIVFGTMERAFRHAIEDDPPPSADTAPRLEPVAHETAALWFEGLADRLRANAPPNDETLRRSPPRKE